MRRVLVAVLPLVALAVLVAVALVPARSTDPRPPREVPVDQTSYACPTGTGRTVGAGQVDAGTEAEALSLPDGDVEEDLLDATTWRTTEPGGDGVLVRQRGDGSGAVGFVAGTRAGALSLAACPAVVDEAWFSGLGSTTQHRSELVLTNLANAPAVVDLSLYGTSGPIDAVDADGVVVEPMSTVRIPLGDLAAGEDDVALRLERRRGALAALVSDVSPEGRDLVPAGSSPAAATTIGPLPASGASRVLRLVNPSDATARVEVEALGDDGPFVPEGLDDVEVAAGSTTTVDLPDSLGETPVTLRLSAGTPVTGSVQTVGRSDVSVVPAAPAWSGSAVVPVRLARAELDALVLAADGDGEQQVSIVARDEAGQEIGSTRVGVGAATTTPVDLGELDLADAATLLVRSESDVLATASYGAGRGLADLPLRAAPVTAEGPSVGWGAPRP